jgi:hypothetical protein
LVPGRGAARQDRSSTLIAEEGPMPRSRTNPTATEPPSAERPDPKAPEAAPADRPEYRVEALAKGLRLLTLFDEQRPTWRITDLAAAAGLPMPTVYRVVMTLTAEGYLEHLPNGDYWPPPSCSGWARAPGRRSTSPS